MADRLGQMLVEWAEWRRQAAAAGYPSTDLLWRAQFGRGGQHDNLPDIWKLKANPEVKRVDEAVNSLKKEHKRLMEFVRTFYVVGPSVMNEVGWTHKEMNEHIAAAHKLIREEMRLRV